MISRRKLEPEIDIGEKRSQFLQMAFEHTQTICQLCTLSHPIIANLHNHTAVNSVDLNMTAPGLTLDNKSRLHQASPGHLITRRH